MSAMFGHEFLQILDESEKCHQFSLALWSLHVLNCSELLWICFQTFPRQYMSDIGNLFLSKLVWRKSLLLKYIGLPIPPFFFKSKFNFSQTVCEMVFVSFEVEENVFSSVSSSLVPCLSAVTGCISLLSRVKPLAKGWFQLAPVSWPSCRQQASLFMHGHGRAAFPFLLQILLLFQTLGHRCRIFQGIKNPPF